MGAILFSNFGLLGQVGFATNDFAGMVQDAIKPKPVDVRQTAILFGALAVLVVCLVVLVAYLLRKKNPPDQLQRSAWPASASKSAPVRNRLTTHSQKARRHRRREQKFTTRNPTLAETGGLPPRRPEDQPPAI